jgi:hypothetical protein
VVPETNVLTDAKIRAVKPRDKAFKLTDSHRLYLLVKPGGSRLWKWSYAYNGKQKTMHLGIYPMLSLVDARAKRDEARLQLGEGRDPAIVKRLRIEANLQSARTTFELVAREWHDVYKGSGQRSMLRMFCAAWSAMRFPRLAPCRSPK